MSAGAKGTASAEFVSKPRRDNTIQSAIQGSVPLHPARRCEFRTESSLRFVPQQQLGRDGGRSCAAERLPVDEKIAASR